MNTPNEIAKNYLGVAKTKTTAVWYKLLILGVLAGAFIAFGGALATISGSGFSGIQASLIKGAVFPVGLILVVICGAELFTGNCLLLAPLMTRDVSPLGTLKNLGLSYAGNFIGGTLVALIVVFGHVCGDAAASVTVAVAAAKCTAPFTDTLLRGIGCNMLVCLAVWATMASKSASGKILALYLPIFAFVACGFEHSVANMYYITSGLFASASYGITAAGLNFGNGLLYSLLPSTLGNIIGGALIALAYWAVYFRKPEIKPAHAETPQDEKPKTDEIK